MKSVLILIDNLRIGGFQRVGLDEAYGLARMGHRVKIFVLDTEKNIDSHAFLKIESDRLNENGINVEFIGNNILRQYGYLLTEQRLRKGVSLVISHSLRATVLCKLATLPFVRTIYLVSTIHQLPALSRPIQRLKRFIYAQFTDVLLAYSDAVKQDWEDRVSQSLLSRSLFRKKISVNRNGIYLDRLPVQSELPIKNVGRLIFLGRNTNWKGLNTFINLAKSDALVSFDLLLIIPEFTIDNFISMAPDLSNRVKLISSNRLEDYVPNSGDVHIYPVNYGGSAKFIESISLNCLEMACMGIPSVVTRGGLETWRDVSDFGIFVEVDWHDLHQAGNQVKCLSDSGDFCEKIEDLSAIFRIEKHLEVYRLFLSQDK